MNEVAFWSLIEEHFRQKTGDLTNECNRLESSLVQLGLNEIMEFDRIFHKFDIEAYDGAVWDAAHVVACGCSDDGFYDFRAWLISRGSRIYAAVLQDPEILVDIVEIETRDDIVLEGCLRDVARNAYRTITGQEMPPMNYGKYVLKGETLDEPEKLVRFSKLAQKFGDC